MQCRFAMCRSAVIAVGAVWLLAGTAEPLASGLRNGETRGAASAQDAYLRIAAEALPDGVSGRAYKAGLKAADGQAPFVWRVQSGQLPPGLRLDENSGEISGLPAAPGMWEAAIAVRDAARQSATARIRIRIALPLAFETRFLPKLVSNSGYRFPLVAAGGIAPLSWEIVAGGLPRGLVLGVGAGTISGQTSELGPFTVTIRVRDSSQPRQSTERVFTERVYGPLIADWVEPPAARNSGIYGSLRVVNSTDDDVDLTVIVVAVNEYGKAFTLGYRHFVLERDAESQEIPFGFSLPRGTYLVRVDAVGEIPRTNTIQRAYRETRTLRVE